MCVCVCVFQFVLNLLNDRYSIGNWTIIDILMQSCAISSFNQFVCSFVQYQIHVWLIYCLESFHRRLNTTKSQSKEFSRFTLRFVYSAFYANYSIIVWECTLWAFFLHWAPSDLNARIFTDCAAIFTFNAICVAKYYIMCVCVCMWES